jgi:hypothetical protein
VTATYVSAVTIRYLWPVATIALALVILGFVVVMYLAADEQICFDRSPWWGPPEDPNSECSGLWYSDKHPGEFPWTLPR